MESNSKYPLVKEIICLLGVGTLLTSAVLMPGLGLAAGSIYNVKRRADFDKSQKKWKKFNSQYLKRNLKRLKEQQVVEVVEENGQELIKLTSKGKTKYLKFKLEEVSFKNRNWTGKWYVIIYDISKLKHRSQDSFRRILKQINFYPLQESVYLTPFKCYTEIEYLRRYFNISDEVQILEVSKLENEIVYKQYFGLV